MIYSRYGKRGRAQTTAKLMKKGGGGRQPTLSDCHKRSKQKKQKKTPDTPPAPPALPPPLPPNHQPLTREGNQHPFSLPAHSTPRTRSHIQALAKVHREARP